MLHVLCMLAGEGWATERQADCAIADLRALEIERFDLGLLLWRGDPGRSATLTPTAESSEPVAPPEVDQRRSTIVTFAWPPPSHIVCMP